MPPESPVVSVVIPAYNAAWCVGKAIDSVLAQDFSDLEIIVVNDGSSDDTASVLSRYAAPVRVVHQPNGGLSNARNAGIGEARGEFIAFLDADDWWLPGKLSQQIALMRARPQLGFSSTAARVEDPAGQVINLWACAEWQDTFLAHLFQSNADVAGSGSAVIVRRTLFQQTGGFDPSLRSLEDIDMWMRLAAVADYACIETPLVVILKHPDSMSRNLDVMRDAAIRVMHKNRNLLPQSLRGGFWRAGMAGIHGDYAKWRYRSGRRSEALHDIFQIFRLAPIQRGRLGLSLLLAILRRQSL
jgi:glycosyltransferase involved in cell wall biosynthesis